MKRTKGGMTVDLAAIKENRIIFSNRALKRLIVPTIIEQFLAIPGWYVRLHHGCNGRGACSFGCLFGGIIFSFC